jgi:hypothetical protein
LTEHPSVAREAVSNGSENIEELGSPLHNPPVFGRGHPVVWKSAEVSETHPSDDLITRAAIGSTEDRGVCGSDPLEIALRTTGM